MATVLIVYGNVTDPTNKGSMISAIDAGFSSASITIGGAASAASPDVDVALIKAIDGAAYIGLGDAAGSAPAPASDPHIHLSIGESAYIASPGGRKIAASAG